MIIFFAYKIEGDIAYFDGEESKHCLKVLRKRSGGVVPFTDGKGKLYNGTIMSSDRKGLSIHHISVVEVAAPRPKIIVAISPTKTPSRFEWFVEKAVEIGVTDIVPLNCHRTEKSSIRTDRINKIIRAAAKQSLNYSFPVLHDIVDIDGLIEKYKFEDVDKYIASFHKDNLHLLDKTSSIDAIICIGPEGDFTDVELETCVSNGYMKVNISSSRLRTETAGIIATHLLSI